MAKLTVNNNTTVAELQKFATEMGTNDKLRATYDKKTDSYKLYTSSKGSRTGLKEYLFKSVSTRRANAHGALSKIIFNSAGKMASSGNSLALQAALNHIKSSLTQTGDIRGAQLKGVAGKSLAEALLPQGVTINANGVLSGQVSLSNKLLNKTTSVPVGQAISDGVDSRLAGTSKKGFKDVGGTSVHQEFLEDALRMPFSIGGQRTDVHVVSSSTGRAIGEQAVTTQLRNFAGTDNATKVLSAFLHQGSMNNLTGFMQQKNGELAKLLQPPKDILNAVFVDNNGASQNLGKPDQYSGMNISVDTYNDGTGDFRISVDWDYHFSRVGTSGIDCTALNSSDLSRVAKMNTTTEFRISKQQADLGNFQMQITQPPVATFSGIIN